MAKWVSRFQLGFSNSVPGVRLLESNLVEIDDISMCFFSSFFSYNFLINLHQVSATGSDMTDGCGFTNKAVLTALWKIYKWPEFPVAIQCRIHGAKVRYLSLNLNFIT